MNIEALLDRLIEEDFQDFKDVESADESEPSYLAKFWFSYACLRQCCPEKLKAVKELAQMFSFQNQDLRETRNPQLSEIDFHYSTAMEEEFDTRDNMRDKIENLINTHMEAQEILENNFNRELRKNYDQQITAYRQMVVDLADEYLNKELPEIDYFQEYLNGLSQPSRAPKLLTDTLVVVFLSKATEKAFRFNFHFHDADILNFPIKAQSGTLHGIILLTHMSRKFDTVQDLKFRALCTDQIDYHFPLLEIPPIPASQDFWVTKHTNLDTHESQDDAQSLVFHFPSEDSEIPNQKLGSILEYASLNGVQSLSIPVHFTPQVSNHFMNTETGRYHIQLFCSTLEKGLQSICDSLSHDQVLKDIFFCVKDKQALDVLKEEVRFSFHVLEC